ncbi:MAG TPA: CHAT domain-containing protein [Kofleriaceae bacterium]|nr:CHAT domain-containing protein [Kofleriaceae bacterium]
MKNIMEFEEVDSGDNAVREDAEGAASPFEDNEDDDDPVAFTEDEKALLAAWDKTNAPSRAADPKFEARLLAVLDERMALAPGRGAARGTLAPDLRDDLACANMVADANAEGAATVAGYRAPILVDTRSPDSPSGRDAPASQDWHRWAVDSRARRPEERDELPFMVRSGGSTARRGVDVSWDALSHEDPDDPATLRQKVTRRAEDDRWKLARELPGAGGPELGTLAELGATRRTTPRTAMVLFVAATPRKASRDWLVAECSALEHALAAAPLRDNFRFEPRWAMTVAELAGHLAELDPTILHVVGHGSPGGERASGGMVLQDAQGNARPVPAHALTRMIETAARSLRVVVLSGCYRRKQANALRQRVDCVVGMCGAVHDEAARRFSGELYSALGNGRSIGTAFDRGVASLAAAQPPGGVQASCVARKGVDVRRLPLWDSEPPTAAPA